VIFLFPANLSFGQLSDSISNYIEPLVATNNFSGVVLIGRNGDIIFKQAYGFADVSAAIKMKTDTVFQIASVSKTFTSAAVMRFVERRVIQTSDPVSNFVDDFIRGDEITIHHLLTHTSGIPNINNMDIYRTLEQQDQSSSDLIEYFKDQPLEFDPGEKYKYSNSNYNLLAYVIEQASRKSFGSFLQDEFLTPLGLQHTGHPDTPERKSVKRAVGYQAVGAAGIEPARTLNWSVKTGNGSLYSTVDDLYRWARAFFAGEVVKPQTRDLMLKDYGDHVGYGWFIRPQLGRTQYHMNGRIEAPAAQELVGRYQFGPDFYRPNQLLEVRLDDGYLFIDWGVLLYSGSRKFINRDYWTEVEFRRENLMIMDYGCGLRTSRYPNSPERVETMESPGLVLEIPEPWPDEVSGSEDCSMGRKSSLPATRGSIPRPSNLCEAYTGLLGL